MKNTLFLILFSLAVNFLSAQAGNYEDVIEDIANKLAASLSAKGKKSVTIADFTNLNDAVTELGRDIAGDLETELLSGNYNFSLVSRDQLSRILSEQEISRSRITEKENIKRIGQISNVDVIIVGTTSYWGEQIRVNAQILDVETARMIGAGKGVLTKTTTIKRKVDNLIVSNTETNISTQSLEGKVNIAGEWTMKVKMTGTLDRNGTKGIVPVGGDGIDRQLGLVLSLDGDIISGDFLWGHPQGMCAVGTIDGKLVGNTIDCTFLHTGHCCKGVRCTLIGRIDKNNNIVGKIKPINRPVDNCVSIWADFTMTKTN